MNVQQIVEAVLFASDAPLTAGDIARADESLDEDQVEEAIGFLRAEYDDAARSFQLVELAEGYQVLTRPEFAPYLERFDNVPRSSRLSGPALETLAIVAYRQPIGRLEMEYVRGVGVSGVVRTLQERNLIEVVGRAEGLGRPLLYGTTQHFLEHFGFRSLEDLPRPEELPIILRERVPLGMDDDVVPEENGEGRDSKDPAQGHLELAGGALRDGEEGEEDGERGPASEAVPETPTPEEAQDEGVSAEAWGASDEAAEEWAASEEAGAEGVEDEAADEEGAEEPRP
ncbi:MAG: SMC-Scp complex subunit ScpB [Gemmatimonadota bacterium]|jgi:segregation and condensation protein B